MVRAGRRDLPRVRDHHGAAERVRHAVERLDRQRPHRVGHDGIAHEPDGEREQHQRHAVPVSDPRDYPPGTEEYRYLAAERLHALRQALQRFDPRQVAAVVFRGHVFDVPVTARRERTIKKKKKQQVNRYQISRSAV